MLPFRITADAAGKVSADLGNLSIPDLNASLADVEANPPSRADLRDAVTTLVRAALYGSGATLADLAAPLGIEPKRLRCRNYAAGIDRG